MAAKFASLPDEVKKVTETPHAYFQVGWSHGNEKLQGDKPDWAKGSYYCNPLVDRPTEDEALIKQYPSFLEPNVWPTCSIPEFEGAFKSLGRQVVEVGRMLAYHCDAFVEGECEGYEKGAFYKLLCESKCCKGRLLHYFPSDEVAEMNSKADGEAVAVGGEATSPGGTVVPSPVKKEDEDTAFSNSCGWHNDHGSLTGLVPAMYLDKAGVVVPNPDPASGLYVRSRSGKLVQVKFPVNSNCVAFQIGETSQIHTGGVLQATPHAVRGAEGAGAVGISRDTFAVFMEPEYDGALELPAGKSVADVQSGEAVRWLPKTVKTLGSRWVEGMDFGEFSEKTFEAFY